MLKKSILMLGSCAIAFGGLACSKRPSPPPPETPGLYIDDASVKEGADGSTVQMTFTVRLSPARDGEVSVDYTVVTADDVPDFKAPAGVDVAQLKATKEEDISGPYSGRISIPAGASEGTISVTVKGDDVFERNELFGVKLSGASGADIQRAAALGTIENDDSAPTVSLVLPSSNVSTILERADVVRPFKVRIEGKTALPVTFSLSFGDETEQANRAAYYSDYVINDGVKRHTRHSLVTILPEAGNPAARERDFSLEVVNDGAAEGDEDVVVAAISPVDAKLSSAQQLNWTILANDAVVASTYRKLNDTGITELVVGLDVPTIGKQDAEIGLDAVVPGTKGFRFVKLAQNGVALPDQSVKYETTPWSCVRDETTGLIWEHRPNTNEGLHAASRTVSWYEPNSATNGGDEGERGVDGVNEDCRAEAFYKSCNTSTIVAETNLEKYCGLTGWRLPTVEELRSVVDYGASKPTSTPNNPTSSSTVFFYDREFFTGLLERAVWTSTSFTSTGGVARQAIAISLYSLYEEKRVDKNQKDGGAIWLVNDNNGSN